MPLLQFSLEIVFVLDVESEHIRKHETVLIFNDGSAVESCLVSVPDVLIDPARHEVNQGSLLRWRCFLMEQHVLQLPTPRK